MFTSGKKNLVIIISVFLIGCLIIFLFFNKKKNYVDPPEPIKYELKLIGNEEIINYLGDIYVEPGYELYDNDGNIYTDKVKIEGNVDTNKEGIYEIMYTFENIVEKRKVYVIDKPESYPYIALLEDEKIYVNKRDKYVEPGYIAIDDTDGLLQENVLTEGIVDTYIDGVYEIKYSITNSKGITYETKREVVVTDKIIDIRINNLDFTKDNLILNVGSLQPDYAYMRLPDGTMVQKKYTSYEIIENGTYVFESYNSHGNMISNSIVVSNIDREVNKATCRLDVKEKTSTIVIDATDSGIGISKYKYNNSEYSNNTIEINERITEASITVYDKLDNFVDVKCDVNVLELPMYGFILIGDSRFVGMKTHTKSIVADNVTFVAKGAMGIDWFKKTAINEVNKILEKYPDRRYYILCNLGINDFKYNYNKANYGELLTNLAKGDWKGHKVGYISVNPYAGTHHDSTNKKVIAFNERQQKAMDGVYYCDTYNGIGQPNFKGSSSSDQLHYNKSTSIAVYNYIYNNCNF